jgi:hypothetical protein
MKPGTIVDINGESYDLSDLKYIKKVEHKYYKDYDIKTYYNYGIKLHFNTAEPVIIWFNEKAGTRNSGYDMLIKVMNKVKQGLL